MSFKSRKKSFVHVGKRYYEGRTYDGILYADIDDMDEAARRYGLAVEEVDPQLSDSYDIVQVVVTTRRPRYVYPSQP